MTNDDLCFLSALELRQAYHRRELSPVEVVKATLDRIEHLDPQIGAFVTVTDQLALHQAVTAERAYARGQAGPLCGIPYSLKDLTATRHIRTTRGSLLYKDWIPDFDAPVAGRLLRAGGILLGKTNTPELGWKGDSGNRVSGPTHNPWKQGHTAGGSSGGAAAAVAAGLGPLAQGTDGAGSIRIPAAFCGIYGIKPSWGLVPQYPASVVELFSHTGPMTRTVGDAALMLDVMAGADPRDRTSKPSNTAYLASLPGNIDGLRVAWSPDLGYAAVEPEVAVATATAAARFADLGCRVEEAHPDLGDPWDIVHIFWASAFAGAFHERFEEIRDMLDPGLLAVIEQGRLFSAAELGAANGRRLQYYQHWLDFMVNFDLLLTPSLPLTAFAAGSDQPGHVTSRSTTYLSWTAFTYPFNITGQPAATVPCGWRHGLPVGLQIVGRWQDDTTVLRASAAFEAISPWDKRPPVLNAPQ